jgi:hypothetical protein
MKTITEFSGFSLKEAIAKKAALIAEGKTEEEAQAAINEQLKLADDAKISFYKNAVDMTASRVNTVKRVVVALKATETESVPTAFAEREGHFYLIEYFPDGRGAAPSAGRDDDRFGRGGRGGGKGRGGRDGGGRGNDRGDRSGGGGRPGGDRPRAPREDRPAMPRPEGSFAALKPVDPNAPKPARAPRPPRNNNRPPRDPNAPRAPRASRPPRADQAMRGPKGAAELRLVLKGQSSTLQGSGPAEAAAPAATPAAE